MPCRFQCSGRRTINYSAGYEADYDSQVDVLSIVFNEAQVEESDEIKPGVILDYDAAGNVVGLEILDASRRVQNPAAMEFAVKAA